MDVMDRQTESHASPAVQKEAQTQTTMRLHLYVQGRQGQR